MHEKYRERLNRERTTALSNLGLKLDPLTQNGRVGEEDQAQIIHEEFVSMRLNLIEYTKLKMVNEALERIIAGEYGVCRHCEKPIPDRRLEVLPWAKYCVPCQEHVASIEDETAPVWDFAETEAQLIGAE